jgi:Glycine/D-amino acid oxidases (deaminating)
LPEDLLWVQEHLTDSYLAVAPVRETAQVHPYLFTTAILEFATQMGVILLRGKATLINKSDSKVTGVTYSCPETQKKKTIPATHVLLSAGAWSPTLLSTLPITTNRAHSITIRPKPTAVIAPYVLFTEIKLPSSGGETFCPEIYPRPDNEVYASGRTDAWPLPVVVDDVPVDHTVCENIREQVSSISPELRGGEVEKRQACFLPIMSVEGGPIVGEARKIARNLFIATGHSCWVSDYFPLRTR